MLAKINPALEPLCKPLSELFADPKNARKHDAKNLGVIKKSLSMHGQQKPVVVMQDGRVIAGNGTVEAARSLGWDRIAVVTYDDEDEAKAAAYAIVDNRSTDLSSWEHGALVDTLNSLTEELLAGTGFDTKEVGALLSPWADPPARVQATIEYDPDSETKLIKIEVKARDAQDIVRKLEAALIGTSYKPSVY